MRTAITRALLAGALFTSLTAGVVSAQSMNDDNMMNDTPAMTDNGGSMSDSMTDPSMGPDTMAPTDPMMNDGSSMSDDHSMGDPSMAPSMSDGGGM
jgi:hypothetical protein